MNEKLLPGTSHANKDIGDFKKEEVMDKYYLKPNEGSVDGPMIPPAEQARRVSEKLWGGGANVVRLGSAALADRAHLNDADHEESLRSLRNAFASVVEKKKLRSPDA